MTINLENEYLRIGIKTKGAELFSVLRKENQLEYMWSGDPAFWGKTSPILFPIIGTLKDDTYFYENKSYKLSRHGFARDAEFEILKHENQVAVFFLKNSPGSFKNYPFAFELFVKYSLDNDELKVSYEVRNTGANIMYFSMGAHPAFTVPLTEGTVYEDYFLEFDSIETAPRWPINKEGLIEKGPIQFFNNSSRIDLSHKLFEKDALVFKDVTSNKISLKTNKHAHGLDFHFEGFPFLGLWAAKGANFVCIEPWCGIADSVDHNQNFIEKDGIQMLSVNDSWSRQWKIKPY